MATPISSYKAFLMKGTGSGAITWQKLVDIKEFPDLGAAPEPLETTTLSDFARTYIPGIENVEQKTFTANYTSTDYATLMALKGQVLDLAIWFGGTEDATTRVVTPTGAQGRFAGQGYVDVFVAGAGVNEVVNMTITLTMTKNFVGDVTISG